MNSIEVKLQGETRRVEFDQPVLWSDLPVARFYRSRNFWIGVLAGTLITLCVASQFCIVYNEDIERIIGIEGAKRLEYHGLSWQENKRDWVRDETKPPFPIAPSP